MSSVITFYICTKWIKFTQLFILGFISSSLYLEDMSRERKHWLQQFHMIFIYCVWCHLSVSALFDHFSGRLACSLVKQLHLCSQALADSSQSKKHIGRPLYKAQGKLHTFIKRRSSRCIRCLPGFAGVNCVYMTWLTLCHCWWCQQDDTDHGACTSTGHQSPPDREY